MDNSLLFDLQGNKKQFAYQFTRENFEAVMRNAISEGKYKVECSKPINDRAVAYLVNGSDLAPLHQAWVIVGRFERPTKLELIERGIVSVIDSMHSHSVETAIESGQFQQEYMCGRLSKEEVAAITKPYFDKKGSPEKIN